MAEEDAEDRTECTWNSAVATFDGRSRNTKTKIMRRFDITKNKKIGLNRNS